MAKVHQAVKLSDRQFDVWKAISYGLETEEVMSQLGMSRGTLKHHLSKIADQVGTASRVVMALRYHGITPGAVPKSQAETAGGR